MMLFLGAPLLLSAMVTEAQRSTIDQATASKGVFTEAEDTYKVTFPRTDVKVTVEGRPMPPFLGFSSWAAFTSGPHGDLMVMGDVVLMEDEVNPAMSAALDAGLEVTALHNHFFFEAPRVMYMHIGGSGSADQLALAVRKVLDAVKAVRAGRPVPASSFAGVAVSENSAITAPALDAILGVKGETNSGMYKATIGRSATMHGSKVGKQMGVNTWAAFAGTDANALVDGDFAMTKDELQGVLKTLRKGGINIVAIHNHMTHEEPQYVFLHYWGKGPAAQLATTIAQAMTQQRALLRGAAESREIVFVCEHGAAKSVIAAAELNRIARLKGLALHAVYRATSPSETIAPAVSRILARDGINMHDRPSVVTGLDVERASTVVTMGASLPPGVKPADLREWNDVPSVSDNLEAAWADIRRRVEGLVEDIGKSSIQREQLR
ncbi:MAG: DUF1259 domain-containing protein [Paludibaculum sp.]